MIIQNKEEIVPRFEPLSEAEILDAIGVRGFAHGVLRNGDGEIKHEAVYKNLVTAIGNEYYGERAAGIAAPPDQVTGGRLGTGTTAPSATGAGAAIVTYKTGSNVAVSGGYPQSSNPSGGIRRITWLLSWAAGVATDAALAEAVLTNETPLTNVAGLAANTIARLLLSPLVSKGASDTFDLTWFHEIGA